MKVVKQLINELIRLGFFDAVGDAISIQDTGFRILYQNRKAKDIIGDRVGELCYEVIEKRDKVCPGCPLALTFKDGKVRSVERTNPSKKRPLIVEITTSAIKNQAGEIIAGMEVVRDVTKRKLAEGELEERMHLAELAADVGIALTGGGELKDLLRGCSEAMVRHLDALFARIWTFNEAENVLELQSSAGLYTHIDGFHSRIPYGGNYKISLIARERKPHLTNNLIGDPLVHDQAWAKREGVRAFAGQPLLVKDKLVGVMAVFSCNLLNEITIKALQSVADEIAIGIEHKQVLNELRQHQQHLEKLVASRTTALKDLNEQLQTQIRERISTEEALRESETKFRNIYEGSPIGIEVYNPRGKLLQANKACLDIFGVSDINEIKGFNLFDDPNVSSETKEKLRAGAIVRYVAPFDFEKVKNLQLYRTTKSGVIYLDVLVSPIKIEKGKKHSGFLIHVQDITERKNAEAEVFRSAHLASLGEMAAGVAHEINNPINGIINYTQILANKSRKGSKQKDIAERIIKESDRIANIVKSLLSFARNSEGEKHPVHIHEIISESLQLTEAQLRKDGINLKLNVPRELPAIIAHPHQIEQVFLNIISNARYALNHKFPGAHDGKVLEIRGGVDMVHSKKYLRVTFHDKGTGIPSDILDKVIHPFFTTKPGTIGTGLGLSISHGIISNHGGRLMINSTEGVSTDVIIDLPLM